MSFYGPFTKQQWDDMECEFNRQMDEAGITGLGRFHTCFEINLETGEIHLKQTAGDGNPHPTTTKGN